VVKKANIGKLYCLVHLKRCSKLRKKNSENFAIKECCTIIEQRFQGPPNPTAILMDSPHQNHDVHINNRYINSLVTDLLVADTTIDEQLNQLSEEQARVFALGTSPYYE
jgi:hypothetical protein